MVDEVTKSLDEMAADVESLARTNEQQTEKIESIAETAGELETAGASQAPARNSPTRLEPDDF